jgi:hypothetical protein
MKIRLTQPSLAGTWAELGNIPKMRTINFKEISQKGPDCKGGINYFSETN